MSGAGGGIEEGGRAASGAAPDHGRLPAAAAGGGAGSGLITLCAAAVVVGALYLGRDLLVPLVLAVLLAFVLAPVARLLRRLRIGRVASVVVAVLLAIAALLGLGLAVSGQVAELAARLPAYRTAVLAKLEALRLGEMLERMAGLLRGVGDLTHAAPAGGGAPAPPAAAAAASAAPAVPAAPAAPVADSPLQVVLGAAETLLAPLATAGLVIVFVIFVLLYREDLRDRLIRLAGARDLHRTMAAMNDAAWRLSRLFLAQVALNTGFGLFVGVGLWLIGLPNPALFGMLAGLMRFVPFIGTPIAVVPPLLLAVAVDPGWSMALWVLALFLVSEPLMGQVFEPLLYGHSTGLSPLSVILAATFWAFLWGPIGLLLATPLTVCLVVLGRHVERLEFLEVMLGDRPSLQPEETFYQRALEGDADGLVAQARRHLRERGGGLSGWCDAVALRGLGLAQADWAREVLEPERAEGIRREVAVLLDDLAEQAAAPAAAGEAAAPSLDPAWRLPGAVLCVAGQGPFDLPAASTAALVLRQAGLGAEAAPNAVLEAARIEELDPARTRLCLLSVLEEGSSAASVRYFLRRLRRRLPEARVVVGLWHAAPDSPMLAALREDQVSETIVTTVGEALALCEAAAAAAAPGDAAAPPAAYPPSPQTSAISGTPTASTISVSGAPSRA